MAAPSVAPELYGIDWIYLLYLLRSFISPTSSMSQSSQSQPLLSPDDLTNAEDHTSSPSPHPGEQRMHLRSHSTSRNAASEGSGGRSTCSTSGGRGQLPPPDQLGPLATPITPSRTTAVTTRTETPASRVSAPTYPNAYAC